MLDGSLVIQADKDMPPIFGVTGDAVLQISVDGAPSVTVTVDDAATLTNRNILDLVADLDSALDDAGLGSQLEAKSVGNRLIVTALNDATTFSITAAAGTPAVTELGFATSQTADQADFVMSTRDGTGIRVTLDGDATLGDIIESINSAPGNSGKVTAAINDAGIALELTDTTSGLNLFRIDATNGSPAGNRLGIVRADTARDPAEKAFTGAEVTVQASNRLTLSGDQSAAILQGDTVTFTFVSSATATTEVASAIFDPGTNVTTVTLADAVLAGTLSQALFTPGDRDGKIQSSALGGVSLTDRLFLANAEIGASLSITGDVEAAARFGFVAVVLSGDANLDLSISLGLEDPGTVPGTDGRITLREFLDALSDISTLIPAPDLSGTGDLTLGIALDPAIPGINLGTDPQIVITVNDIGNPFTGEAPDIDFTFPDLGDLISFDNIDFNFQTIIQALILLSDFLGQFEAFGFLDEPIPLINKSVNDLLSFAEEFGSALDEAQANPAGTLQFLEGKLKQAFGLPADSTAIGLSLVRDADGDVIKFHLGLEEAFSESLDIDLNLADLGVPDFISLAGAAGLRATGSLDIDLDFGIDLDDPTNFYLFKTTGIDGTLTAAGDNISFRAALGPLGLFIRDGSAEVGLGFVAGLDDAIFTVGEAGNERVLLTDISLGSDFEANLSGTLPGDELVSATLPAYFPTESVAKGDILVGIGLQAGTAGFDISGTLPGDEFISIPDDLFDIDPSDFSLIDNILLAIDGLDAFLAGLQDVLDGEVFGITLPLVGDKLSSAAGFIEDFRTGFLEDFRREVENAADPNENFISVKLFELLGPSGLDILRDLPDDLEDGDDAIVDVDDVRLTTNINQAGLDPDLAFMQWNMILGQDLVDVGTGIDFDLGIPGLGLETRGAIDLNIAWELAFGFGINFTDIFYLDISDPSELELSLDVTVPGGGLTGKLAILQINADDNGDTHLSAQFGIDVFERNAAPDDPGAEPDDGDHLGFAELGSIGLNAGLAAEAIVDLGLELQLNSDLVPGADTVFPKVVGDFFLEWGFGTIDDPGTPADETVLIGLSGIGNAIKDGLQLVEFRNVGVDLGSFLTDVLGPIVKQVQEITKPIQPLIEVLTEPIPVISDLAGSPITLLDIAQAIVPPEKFNVGLIRAIADIVTLINSIPTPGPGEDLVIIFGGFTVFDFDSSDPNLKLDLSNKNLNLRSPSSGFATPTNPGFNFDNALASKPSSSTKSFTTNLRSAKFGSGFSFPILTDPSQVFGLLLGREATLIEYDMPALSFEFEYTQFFPVFGPLGVSITLNLGADIDFGFGYDTLGIRRFADGDFRNPLLLFDGFFVDQGDRPEVILTGGLTAAAELNLGVARAGVAGGGGHLHRGGLRPARPG
jgi:hypothetical protein